MFPKCNLNKNFLFLIILLLLSLVILIESKAKDKSKSKLNQQAKAKGSSKRQAAPPHSATRVNSQTRQSKSEMKINNNFQVRGNITTSKLTTKDINITGQAIVAQTSTAQEVDADKIGVQQVQVKEINSPNVKCGNLVITNQLSTDSSISAKSFIVQGVKQWALRHHDDFESDHSISGWSHNLTNNCSNNTYLGGPCQLSYDEAQKLYEKLPPHSQLRINAKIHMFDDWNGEKAYLKVNNKLVWVKTGKKSLLSSPSKCGRTGNDPEMPIDITIPHNESSVTISFGSSLKKHPCSASFGVDDVMIYVK